MANRANTNTPTTPTENKGKAFDHRQDSCDAAQRYQEVHTLYFSTCTKLACAIARNNASSERAQKLLKELTGKAGNSFFDDDDDA